MTGDPILDKLLGILGGMWPWLVIGILGYALLALWVYQRRSLDREWEREFVRTVREARAAGVVVTEHDTVATMRQKMADRRQG